MAVSPASVPADAALPIPVSASGLSGIARLGAWAVLGLALANGAFLYFTPFWADDWYAWPIAPAVLAGFLGAGYLVGAVVAATTVLFVSSWRAVRPLLPGVIALSLIMVALTAVYGDKFELDYAPTWLWIVVYTAIPPVGLWVIRRQDQIEPPDMNVDPRVRLWRQSALILGGVVTLAAVALLVIPNTIIDHSPLQVAELFARVASGWYALSGVSLLAAGLSVRQVREVPITFLTSAVWSLLLLVLVLRYGDDFSTDVAGFWVWLMLHLALLVWCGWVAWRGYSLMRAAGQSF